MESIPEVELRSVDTLIPYARNSRTHSAEQVMQIAASIKEFGWTNPVLVDGDNGIIAGHGRILAAIKLGIKKVPVIELAHLTETQRKAYILADNKLALNAEWDLDMLSFEMGHLQDEGFDLSLIGFDVDELVDIFADKTEGLTDPDAVPDLPGDPITKLGDVWLLGKHRLKCGDSTSVDDVSDLMSGREAELCFTSPPYAQQRNYNNVISDWDVLLNGVFSAISVKSGAQVLVNLGLVHQQGRVDDYWSRWLDFMSSNGWPLFGWYVWDQGHGMPGNQHGRLAPSHEFIFHFAKSSSQANKWVDKKPENIKLHIATYRKKEGSLKLATDPASGLQKTKIADSVIRVNRAPSESAGKGHPAMFPVALCDYIYKSFAKAGDCIYEPFGGAGTSIIACEMFGANCYAMEISPAYVDVAVKRWQDFTGGQAILEGSGATFPTIKKENAEKEETTN